MNRRHWFPLEVPYGPQRDVFKAIPGPVWDSSIGGYWVTRDVLELLDIVPPPITAWCANPLPMRVELKDYQRKAVTMAMRDGRVGLMFDPGLGKTLAALEALRVSERRRVLLICPVNARDITWPREIEKWGYDLPYTSCKASAKIPEEIDGILAISFGLLKHVRKHEFDALIIDESQNVKNSRTQRARALEQIRMRNPEALTIIMSGEPAEVSLMDLRNQINALEPKAGGGYMNFAQRYMVTKPGQYSQIEIIGPNQERAEELQKRLAYYFVQQKRAEDLPDLTLKTWYLEGEVEAAKLEALKKWNALHADIPRLCFTHKRAWGKRIAKELGGLYIDGTLTSKKRIATLEEAKDGRLLVATMKATGVSIDLTFCREAVFAELLATPGEMRQSIKRVHRLSSTESVNVAILVVRGTVDETRLLKLKMRTEDIGEVMDQSTVDGAVGNALYGDETEEEFDNRMGDFFKGCQVDELLGLLS